MAVTEVSGKGNKGPVSGDYTPAWTGSVGNPAIGDGFIAGRFIRFGKMVTATINLVMGSTTTYGSGEWSFSLPFAIPSTGNAPNFIGTMYMLDSGTSHKDGICRTDTTTTLKGYSAVNGGAVQPTYPHTFAVDDELEFTITYEAAD